MRKRPTATRRLGTRRAVTALTVGALVVIGTASTVDAAPSCGTHSFGFEGTRLLNDGISDTAGPFTIALEAGIYDVTMMSNDSAHLDPVQITQPAEQWFFTLDSGYTSPTTDDIPDHETDTSLVATSQTIGTSTQITVRHRGVGGINSVNVVCVGFTPVPDGSPTEPTVVPATPQPVTGEPPDSAKPGTEQPVTETIPPASIVRTPAVPVEVEGKVERPGTSPQLALTGLRDLAIILSAVGVGMIGLGVALVGNERRLRSDKN